VTQAEIRSAFVAGWRVASIEPAVIDITVTPVGAQAWLSDIVRTEDVSAGG
jgi:hypothetical protein